MVYSDIAIFALLFAVFFDLFGIKTQLLTKAVFWTSYAIILPFQLVTNWWQPLVISLCITQRRLWVSGLHLPH